MVDHRDGALAEGLWVTAAPGHCCFSQALQHTPVKALQAEGCAADQWEGEQEEERHNTLQPGKRKGFCIRDYVTFDMSYISQSSTRELTLCPATLAGLTLDSHC